MVRGRKNTAYFDPVVTRPDFPKMERKLLSHWYKSGIVKKYLTKNSKSQKIFSFLDGPITANNPMGVHHAWGRAYKDLFQRYKNMRGYRERFQNGFDEQGLWVEVEVERELGIKTKKDIENLVPGNIFRSLEKFVNLCKARVAKYSKIQTEQSKRLGYFMDWDRSYHTSSDSNNYMIWYFLSRADLQGLIYEGLDAVAWCPRCGTAISNHEILTEGYRELTHTAVTIKYPIVGRSGEFLLVWTTTPWTLPGNVALAVNPALVYSRVKISAKGRFAFGGKDEIYYIAKDRIVPVLGTNLEVLDEVTGDRLLDILYKGPFDSLEAVEQARLTNPRTFHIVIDGGELVTSQEGTGLVHIAPGAGHEDFVLGRREKLPVINVIDEEAKFLAGFGKFSGKATKDQKIIIENLKKEGWLVAEEQYTHRYPVCWRCGTDLVFRAVPEWYIAMDPLRNTMSDLTRQIRWIPEFCRERELDWIKNMDDWLISKKRYWGLALPIWKCAACSHFTVISGKDELRSQALSGWEKFSGHSPHKPWIDEVKTRCEKCGEIAERIPDVGNPWLDAGIVPFSTITDPKSKPAKGWSQPKVGGPMAYASGGKVSYATDKKYWSKYFPTDFITESFPGQFKGWFYSLLAMSAVLEGKEPFRAVLGHATVLAEDGRPMHKSWGNSIEFNDGADKIGVDTMRWLYTKQDPAKNLLFGYKVGEETRRSFHLPLWNIYNFFVTYANFDNWKPPKTGKNTLKVPKVSHILDKWIIARVKQLSGVTTWALDDFNASTAAQEIEKFVADFSNWYIRRSRERVGPTSDANNKENFYKTCYFVQVLLTKLLAPFLPFISELIFTNLTKRESVHLAPWPEIPLPDRREEVIIDTMTEIREASEAGHAARKSCGIKVRQPLLRATIESRVKSPPSSFLTLLAEELNVKNVVWKKRSHRTGSASGGKADRVLVTLSTKITKELMEEGKARDLVREIQEKRRNLGLGISDTVNLKVPWLPKRKSLVSWIKSKTLAENIEEGGRLVVEKV